MLMADLTIPDEAVEQAAEAFSNAANERAPKWGSLGDAFRNIYRRRMRIALEDSMPLIVAAELDRQAADAEQQMLNEREDSQDKALTAGIRNVHTGAAAAYGLTVTVLRERARQLRGA